MRLLNTQTLRVTEFLPGDIPRYAILSHTWEKEEVTFQDIQSLEVAKAKAGFAKVVNACARARQYKFEWIWIDSCCINKESSAELSEALNSMYQYYEDAAVCYVYLCDVSASQYPRNPKSDFRRSRWFTRGWTLQELLAPDDVVFLDKDWLMIGTRRSLRDVISAITTIPVGVFEGQDIDRYSVAQRMSWASFRETTRPEDQAYSLMGLFGINMPPIYGEGGAKAFMRLQQEIIKISDDRSIFAWVATPSEKYEMRGMFARSPKEFRMSGEVTASWDSDEILGGQSSYSFGNNGLHIHLPLQHTKFPNSLILASLLCQSSKDGTYMSIYLLKRKRRYFRYHSDELVLSRERSFDKIEEVIVRENREVSRRKQTSPFQVEQPLGIDICHVELLPAAQHLIRDDSTVLESMDATVEDATATYVRLKYLRSLAYQYQTTGETFKFGFTLSNHFWLRSRSQNGTFYPRDSDSVLGRLTDGSYISITKQVRGDSEKGLTIDYIPPKNPQIKFLTQKLQFPVSGFTIPFKVGDHLLTDIFPMDFFTRKLSEDSAYVTVDSSATSYSNSFRVVTYCAKDDNDPSEPSPASERPFHVVFGLGPHGDLAWTDIIIPDDKFPETAEDVWISYLESGFRYGRRSQTSRSVHDLQMVIASVETRKTLQLGSHLIHLELSYT